MSKRIDTTGGPSGSGEGLTHSPFASLKKLDPRGPSDSGSGRDEAPQKPSGSAQKESADPPARVEVRHERKGRGGKTVTLIRWLEGSLIDAERKALAKTLGARLGTGARVEGEQIVLQGDHRERVATELASKPGLRVVQGS